jgi:hypothetical protein
MPPMPYGKYLAARCLEPRIYRRFERARSLQWKNCKWCKRRNLNLGQLMRRLIIALLILAALIGLAAAAYAGPKRLHPEKYYQAKWCAQAGGLTEVVLSDGTRCDCLTQTHAIEFDFTNKWAEGIGQALHYASMTGKRAGLVLIMERPRDRKYLDRVMDVVRWHGLALDVWIIEPTP